MVEMVRPYRGISPADRRDERRARLLASGLEVVAETGLAGVTVQLICQRAGLSKRYFYESFDDLDALLVSTLDGIFDRVRDAIVAGLAGAEHDPHTRAVRTVDALVATLAADAGTARLYAEAPGLPVLRARRDEAVDRFVDLLLREVFQLPTGARERLATLVVVAGTTEAVSRWLAGPRRRPSRAQLVAEIAELGAAVAASLR